MRGPFFIDMKYTITSKDGQEIVLDSLEKKIPLMLYGPDGCVEITLNFDDVCHAGVAELMEEFIQVGMNSYWHLRQQ